MQLMSLYDCTLSLHVLTHAVLQPMQLMSQYSVCVNPCCATAHAVDVSVLCVCYTVNPCCAAAHAVQAGPPTGPSAGDPHPDAAGHHQRPLAVHQDTQAARPL